MIVISKEDQKWITDNYANTANADMSKILGISEYYIKYFAKLKGLKKSKEFFSRANRMNSYNRVRVCSCCGERLSSYEFNKTSHGKYHDMCRACEEVNSQYIHDVGRQVTNVTYIAVMERELSIINSKLLITNIRSREWDKLINERNLLSQKIDKAKAIPEQAAIQRCEIENKYRITDL